MDNFPDNFTVMTLPKSWVIKNNIYRIWKVREAYPEEQLFGSAYTRINLVLGIDSTGLLYYILIILPNYIIAFCAA
jgi:hypothetical protein